MIKCQFMWETYNRVHQPGKYFPTALSNDGASVTEISDIY